MPYQTGTFTSFADLKTTIETFSTTNGWTLTSGVLSKAGVHVKFDTSDANYFKTTIGTGDDGSGNLTNQAVFSGVSAFHMHKVRAGQTIGFPATYHLISAGSPDNIFLVINYNVVWCQHLAFGNCLKYGTWGGGQYVSSTGGTTLSTQYVPSLYAYSNNGGSNNVNAGAGAYLFSATDNFQGPARTSSAFNCDLDALATGWRANNSKDAVVLQNTFGAAGLSTPYLNLLNSVNLQPAMAPVVFVVGRPSSLSSVVGTMPHARYLRVDNYQPGDIVSVGAQKWIVFPHTSVAHYNGGWAIKYDGP